MSDNPFALSNIEQGGGAAAPANDNPFALSNIERDQQADLRVELQRAVRTNPDQAARAAHLAKKYPVPQDVLARNLQDVEFQAAVDAADERLRTSPTLAKAMRDGKSWLAPQAHDDVEPLAQVEQFFRDTGGSVKAGVFNASKGAAGVFRAGFELVAPALDILEPVTAVGGNPLRRLAEGFALQAEAAGASAKAATPQTSNVVSAGFQSGIQSLTQNLLTLPMAFAPGGQAAALGGMTAFTGGQSYQDAREKGLPMTQALPFAASQAAIEYATEKLPLARLVGDVKAGTPFFQMLARQVAAEVPGEQVATILQDLNDWAVLNPEKPFSSYLEERPSAAAQTLVATIVGAGGNVAVVKGIETVVNRAVNGSRQIQEAERTSAWLQTALQAAAASKLRERNPETFKQLVQTMAEESGGDMSSVFIDAQTLAQTGVNVAEVFPSAAEQMDAALAANGSVEVSIAEVLTAVPGTPLEQVFLQNARGTADGLSLAEAQQAFEQADQWKAEADRVMAEAQDQAAWQADTDAVKTTTLDQLNTAGRFTPDVNEAYATFVGQFFSVMAARQGVTPQEMYARYPLRVTAQQPGQSGGQLEQALPSFGDVKSFDTWLASNTRNEPDQMERPSGPGDQGVGTVTLDAGQTTTTYDGGMTGRDRVERSTADVSLLFRLDDGRLVYWDAPSGKVQEVRADDPRITFKPGKETAPTPSTDPVPTELAVTVGGDEYTLLFPDAPALMDDAAFNDELYSSGYDDNVQQAFRDARTNSKQFNQTATPYTADTITVDGKERPTTNSNGQRIAATERGLVNFWRWFGDSKVVDDQGRPLVVYHSSLKDMEAFNRTGKFMGHTGTSGISVTDNPEMASRYLERFADFGWVDGKPNQPFNKNVMALYVRAENPLVSDEPIKTNLPLGAPLPANYVSPVVQQGYDALIRNDAISKKGAVKHSTAKNAIKGLEIVVFDPTQIKSAIGNDGTFSGQDANILRQDQQRDLVVTHNLTADNLLHAMKMGGIPVPSLAVTKKDNPLTGFGEITLIGPPEMADPKGYAGTKVFGADIYSPRYPSVTFEFTPKARKQGEAMLKDGMAATGQTYIDWGEVERDGARELERQPAVVWQFLKSKGVEPPVVRTEPKPLPAQLQPFKDDTRHAHELAADPAFVEAVWAAQLEILTRAYGNAADAAADIAQQKENAAKRGRSQLVNSYAQSVVQYQRDARQSGQIDKDATRHALGNQVREADLGVELRDYAAAIVTELNPNERIFQGFTNSGNRKYVPHTLENVVKILKKELRGGENFNYGVGSLRAKFTPQFKSVADIRKNKDRLISAADFDKIKDDINNEFLNMADAMNIRSETLSAIMEDAAKLGVQRAAAQYDVDVGGGRDVQIAEFMARLRNLPTAYFEAKVLREVDLAEFAGAVVPEGVNPEVLKVLADRGVKDIRTYKKGDEADRAAKIGEFNDLFFQQAHGTYTPSQILITLNESANLSTFLHESGHFFLEVMADLASQPNAPADVQADMDALLKWFGIKGNEIVGGATTVEWADRETAPVGSWVKADFAVGGVHPVYQVREMALGDLYLPELDEKGNLQPEKRKYLANYTERAKAGEVPPSITVIEMENGKLRVVDGHRRVMAARAAGKTSIRALVSPLVDTAEGKQEATTENINPPGGSTAGMAPAGASYSAGRTPLEVWRAMTLDQKRSYHERFAESFEQYLLEGKAPTTELQPLFRKFRSWLVNVYKSLTQFMRGRDLKLNDDIRRVFDRMLATDEQIRQAEEAAGMLPDFDATNEAIEKLQARSLRDMKWAVGARSRALKALQKQAKERRKGVEGEVRAEVNAMPEFAAQRDLDTLRKENKRQPNEVEMAVVAEAHGFATTEAMLKAITDVGKKADVIEGMTDQRMLERHGDLIDQRAIEDAATEAVHNAVRARVLATELKAQADALNPRQDTGRTASNGRTITVNALTEAAKQFAQNVVARRRVTDLRKAAAQHRAAEAKAGKRWQEATSAGNTQEAVAAKRDQLLNNYTVKALTEAQAEAKKILEFFRKVTKDGNEKLVERGRDPDVVNAMRAILAAYDVAPRLEKAANDYMEIVARNDPAMFAALQPSVQGALQNAKPIGEMTVEELRGLNDEMQSMWHLAKRSRQMEIDGNLLDRETLEDELVARMVEIGIPDTVPGERSAITNRQELGIKLQFAKSILSRVEQWAERLDGKFGGPFLRYIFQPVKEAADRYRSERTVYRKKFTTLVDGIRDQMPAGPIAAPELGYTFGTARDSGMAEVMHAILHTGNDSNKRKLLLGRNWAAENADGTLDTSRWDAFVQRLIDEGKLTKAHYDFAQGVWDLLEEMKPAAQRAHREVFGRYFAEVTANEFTTPFGAYRGGYVPAQTDSRIVDDAKLRELAEGENESMAYAFPAAPSGFTKARVEYNKPLLLDLRALAQHMDKVLLFTHMQPAITDARRLLMSKRVSYALNRVDPGAYEGMLIPWLNRSAKQIVETPIMGDRKLSRFLAAARARAGMALMFANISNTVQQLTGFSSAAVKVKPSLMMSALAQFVAHPKQVKQEVAQASEFMRDRMLNEVSAMNNVVDEILVNPSLYERSQAWTQRHAYFMQAAVDNTMAPIIWTAAYNQAIGEKMDAKDAVRFADGVIRQTQGSTLPEDVSRFETGPATARVFTQFIGYFNMMANTNTTAVSQIVGEMGVRKGAGKLLYVALVGLLVPIWVAESIALAFKGGPDDEDMDGYLDDWLAAVFGLGTFKGIVAQVPLVGQGAQLVVNRFNANPADDKFSLSPAVALIESTVSAPNSVYKAIVDDGNAQKAVRDVAAAATMLTGLPFYAAARPIGYAAGVAQGKIDPTSEGDAVRGAITGTASKESKSP